MNFKELNILKSSRNSSFLSLIAGVITILNLPKLGLITNMIFVTLVFLIGYTLTITIFEQQKINEINKSEAAKELLCNFNFENAKEEKNNNIFFAIGTFILAIILICYSIKVNNAYMKLSAIIFFISSLFYVKVTILYTRLAKKCIIEKIIMC